MKSLVGTTGLGSWATASLVAMSVNKTMKSVSFGDRTLVHLTLFKNTFRMDASDSEKMPSLMSEDYDDPFFCCRGEFGPVAPHPHPCVICNKSTTNPGLCNHCSGQSPDNMCCDTLRGPNQTLTENVLKKRATANDVYLVRFLSTMDERQAYDQSLSIRPTLQSDELLVFAAYESIYKKTGADNDFGSWFVSMRQQYSAIPEKTQCFGEWLFWFTKAHELFSPEECAFMKDVLGVRDSSRLRKSALKRGNGLSSE